MAMNLTTNHVESSVIELAKVTKRTGIPCMGPQASLVSDVLKAVDAGWFALPEGRNLCYTRRQYQGLSTAISGAPWVRKAQETAATWQALLGRVDPHNSRLMIGYHGRLPNIAAWAQSLPYSGPRRPIQFVAGQFQAKDWLDWVQDSVDRAETISRITDALTPPFMLDANGDAENQVRRLRTYGLIHLLPEYLYSVRGRWLSKEEQNWLWDVRSNRLSITGFYERIAARDNAAEEQNREHWRGMYQTLRALAGVIENLTTYHHPAVSRKLRASFGRKASIMRVSNGCTSELIIECESHLQVGRGCGISDVFVLCNFVSALADEIEKAPPNIFGYHDSSHSAFERIKPLMS